MKNFIPLNCNKRAQTAQNKGKARTNNFDKRTSTLSCQHGLTRIRAAFTCCQYSSRDGRAEKYPVSCTIWSSWKMLHIGMTSMSPPRFRVHANSGLKRKKKKLREERRAAFCCLRMYEGSGLVRFQAGGCERVTHRELRPNSVKVRPRGCKLPPRFKITDRPSPM